jgi:selenocysteine lyase/cysteine desulfurase
VSHVLCTTGAVLPIRQIGELCRERGVISVVDGAQAVGMIPIDLDALGCDFYAASGHKWLLGPKGTGVLYVREGMLDAWRAPYVGAYSDERFDLDERIFEPIRAARSIEYGTRNVPLVEGLGAAIDFVNRLGMEAVAEYGHALAERCRAEVTSIAPLEVLTPEDKHCCASIVTIGAKDGTMDPWRWANALRARHGVRVRPVGEHRLRGLRISLHIFNSERQVEHLAKALRVLAREEHGA